MASLILDTHARGHTYTFTAMHL